MFTALPNSLFLMPHLLDRRVIEELTLPSGTEVGIEMKRTLANIQP